MTLRQWLNKWGALKPSSLTRSEVTPMKVSRHLDICVQRPYSGTRSNEISSRVWEEDG
jgi:hypothetical protein